MNVAGIWWGLPGSWVAIELKPAYVLGALSQHFSHGWFDAYPPVHFYVLSAAWSPLLLLSWMDRVTFDGILGYTTLVLISRCVSLAMAAGIVVAACVCGTRAFGRRAGLIAAAIVAVVAPFLYYAKTANVDVPYLFWWAASMVFYLQLLETGRLRDYVLFAAAATLSVCTKDQAYGLYLLLPLVIVEQIWRTNRAAGVPGALWRAAIDRRLIAGAVTSAALFALCQNLLFNAGGFMEHVRFIIGPGSTAYRVFEPTLAGHLELLRETARLIEISMGWPLFLVGVTGLGMALAASNARRMAIWLIAPTASYYLGFINVILYNYDRFVIPMCFVLAIFGGLRARSTAVAAAPARRWTTAAVGAAFAYTLLYAGTVDVLMIDDSRYAAERWMRAHVGPQRPGRRQRTARVPAAPGRSPPGGHHHDRRTSTGASRVRGAQRRLRQRRSRGNRVGSDDRRARARAAGLSARRDVPAPVAVAMAAGRPSGSGWRAPGEGRVQHAAQHQPHNRDLPEGAIARSG